MSPAPAWLGQFRSCDSRELLAEVGPGADSQLRNPEGIQVDRSEKAEHQSGSLSPALALQHADVRQGVDQSVDKEGLEHQHHHALNERPIALKKMGRWVIGQILWWDREPEECEQDERREGWFTHRQTSAPARHSSFSFTCP